MTCTALHLEGLAAVLEKTYDLHAISGLVSSWLTLLQVTIAVGEECMENLPAVGKLLG